MFSLPVTPLGLGFFALLGLLVGSFANVCILRIPAGESVVTGPSHCPRCEKRLRPWELVPVFSYLALRGRCGKCGLPISAQYPFIELVNALLWLLAGIRLGLSAEALLAALLCSALLVASVIDARTRELPPQTTGFMAVLAVLHTLLHLSDWQTYLLGGVAISGLLLLLLLLSKGRAIGGGDVKLMAACGLFVGFGEIVFAFLLACVVGSVVHLVRMRFFGAARDLAMGPYLSFGVFVSLFWGTDIVSWYIQLLTGA